jgi:hypothetical protein
LLPPEQLRPLAPHFTAKGAVTALLDDFLSALDITPHPALVAIQKPSPAQMTEAMAVCGIFPDEPYLRPVVLNGGGVCGASS